MPAAAAAARLAALLSSLAPDASIPAELLPALGVGSKEPPTAAAAATTVLAGADAPITPTGPLSDALRNAVLSPAPAAAAAAAAAAGAVDATARLEMLLLLLHSLNQGPQQCPALVASLSQQVVACVNQSAGNVQLLPLLLQALLLALTATVSSIAAEPHSVDMHVRVWQHAQDTLQVRCCHGPYALHLLSVCMPCCTCRCSQLPFTGCSVCRVQTTSSATTVSRVHQASGQQQQCLGLQPHG